MLCRFCSARLFRCSGGLSSGHSEIGGSLSQSGPYGRSVSSSTRRPDAKTCPDPLSRWGRGAAPEERQRAACGGLTGASLSGLHGQRCPVPRRAQTGLHCMAHSATLLRAVRGLPAHEGGSALSTFRVSCTDNACSPRLRATAWSMSLTVESCALERSAYLAHAHSNRAFKDSSLQ